MRVLELFSGSKTLSKVAEREFGAKTFSVDKFIESDFQNGIDQVTREIIIESLSTPDAIWASPVCSAWSKTGWFHYWDTDYYAKTKQFKAKNDFANESVEMVRKTIEIFSWFPEAVFWMENPEGMLYRHPVINTFSRYGISVSRKKITYCQYGDSIMKPTHIWTNSTTWKPKRPCSAGDTCHQQSPRGSMKGMYTKSDSFERSMIPEQLAIEVLRSIKEPVMALKDNPQGS
jgi:hypothetical protein